MNGEKAEESKLTSQKEFKERKQSKESRKGLFLRKKPTKCQMWKVEETK